MELVGAILRQGGFIEKMVNLGWTASGRFDDPKSHATLVRCIARCVTRCMQAYFTDPRVMMTRYHAFLFLMETSPGIFLVPTLVSTSIVGFNLY